MDADYEALLLLKQKYENADNMAATMFRQLCREGEIGRALNVAKFFQMSWSHDSNLIGGVLAELVDNDDAFENITRHFSLTKRKLMSVSAGIIAHLSTNYNTEAIKNIMSRGGIAPSLNDFDQRQHLEQVYRDGHRDLVKWMLSRFYCTRSDIDFIGDDPLKYEAEYYRSVLSFMIDSIVNHKPAREFDCYDYYTCAVCEEDDMDTDELVMFECPNAGIVTCREKCCDAFKQDIETARKRMILLYWLLAQLNIFPRELIDFVSARILGL